MSKLTLLELIILFEMDSVEVKLERAEHDSTSDNIPTFLSKSFEILEVHATHHSELSLPGYHQLDQKW
jgi:hypothetical protein